MSYKGAVKRSDTTSRHSANWASNPNGLGIKIFYPAHWRVVPVALTKRKFHENKSHNHPWLNNNHRIIPKLTLLALLPLIPNCHRRAVTQPCRAEPTILKSFLGTKSARRRARIIKATAWRDAHRRRHAAGLHLSTAGRRGHHQWSLAHFHRDQSDERPVSGAGGAVGRAGAGSPLAIRAR